MEELKKSIKEIVEQDIVKVVISNKKDKEKKQKKVNNSSSGNGAGSIGSSDFTFSSYI